MVRVWKMVDDSNIVSQFDQNYAGDYELTDLESKIGVQNYKINVDNLDNDENLQKVKKTMGITYKDTIVISPEKFPNYLDKHLHADDEIRLILEGSGYFDIRDDKDEWVRISVQKGDLITLPAGSYHRFTTDEKNFVHAMRLFVGDPVWTPINRPCDDHFSRLDYLKKYPILTEFK